MSDNLSISEAIKRQYYCTLWHYLCHHSELCWSHFWEIKGFWLPHQMQRSTNCSTVTYFCRRCEALTTYSMSCSHIYIIYVVWTVKSILFYQISIICVSVCVFSSVCKLQGDLHEGGWIPPADIKPGGNIRQNESYGRQMKIRLDESCVGSVESAITKVILLLLHNGKSCWRLV